MNKRWNALWLAMIFASVAGAQPFSSGSTGADGAYSPTVSGDFDPTALGLNPAGDNVFNFTTINIPAGVTIRLRATKARNLPVVWLATGNVTIAGVLNLNGDAGYALDAANFNQVIQNRRAAEPGAGGYYGGLGARGGVGPEAGAGPGGGGAGLNTAAGTCYGGAASAYSGAVLYPLYDGSGALSPGSPYGNVYLVPLYGGSGGGGGWGNPASVTGGGGGAGGGAIRIVSTTQISVTGTIYANGGSGGTVSNSAGNCNGGSGSGGGIQLISPTVTGSGNLNAYSGSVRLGLGNCSPTSNSASIYCDGNTGFIRFNSTNITYTGNVNGNSVPTLINTNVDQNYFGFGPLYNVPNNSTLGQPSLSITQVNGINVPANPQASYLNPDVQIAASGPVTVNIAATNVPVGTVVTLRLTTDLNGDVSTPCNPLAGTLAASTATCTATFPFEVSIAGLRAVF
jgi:hypothetical protein